MREVVCASPGLLQTYGVPHKPENLLRFPPVTFDGPMSSPGWRFGPAARVVPVKPRLSVSTADPPSKPPWFVYDHGTFTTIDVAGQSNTVATAINSRGDIVGYYQDENARYHGFLDHKGAFTTIDEPNANYATWPEDISDNGAIVGIYVNTETGTHGFMLA